MENNNFVVGATVIIQQQFAGHVRPHVYGRGIVMSVGKLKVKLADGSEWRMADGYCWGSTPTRGVGRSFERQIVVAPAYPVEPCRKHIGFSGGWPVACVFDKGHTGACGAKAESKPSVAKPAVSKPAKTAVQLAPAKPAPKDTWWWLKAANEKRAMDAKTSSSRTADAKKAKAPKSK